jgi:protein import protein ZIM17
MVFTCSKCNTRAAKAFSKQSYEHGVVIVDCPGCQAKHLIADNLGWFGRKGTVEEFAAQRGNTVLRRLADGTVELSPQEVLGPGLAGEAAAAAAGGSNAGGGSARTADAGGQA